MCNLRSFCKFIAYESKLKYIFIGFFISKISASTLLIYPEIIIIKYSAIINLVSCLETYILNVKWHNI